MLIHVEICEIWSRSSPVHVQSNWKRQPNRSCFVLGNIERQDVYIWMTWRLLIIFHILYPWSLRRNAYQCVSNTGFTLQIFIHGKRNRKHWNILNLFPPSLRATILGFFSFGFFCSFLLVCFACCTHFSRCTGKKRSDNPYFSIFCCVLKGFC